MMLCFSIAWSIGPWWAHNCPWPNLTHQQCSTYNEYVAMCDVWRAEPELNITRYKIHSSFVYICRWIAGKAESHATQSQQSIVLSHSARNTRQKKMMIQFFFLTKISSVRWEIYLYSFVYLSVQCSSYTHICSIFLCIFSSTIVRDSDEFVCSDAKL